MAEPKKPLNKANAWAEARVLIHANRGRLSLGLLILVVNRAAAFVLPVSAKLLFDEVIPNHDHGLLAWLVAGVLGATLVEAASGFALSQLLGIAAQRAINDLRKTIHDHVLRLPVRNFDATQAGVLISRVMTDAEGVRNLVGTGIVQLVGGLLTGIAAIVVLFWLNWQLTVGILVALGMFGGVLGFAFRRIRPIFRERGRLNAEVTGRLNQTLGGIRIVKAYTAEPRERAVFGGGVDRLFAQVKASMTGISAVSSLATLVIGVVSAMAMVIGGRAIMADTMEIGDLVLYIALTALVAGPVFQIASIGTQITEAFAGLDRIRELRTQIPEDAEDLTRRPAPALAGAVAMEHVDFAYEPGRPVLHDISFSAPAGSTTALVGSSGSGKSTLMSLLMAFNRPQQGLIRVDGHDLATLRLASYRANLGVVMQDNFLFDGTVAENIAFARPEATRADIERVATIARCDEFVRGFEQGYDTVVGERGVKLSGGQRQRVAIARALLADPRILILDEATSSLDSESEAAIQAGLAALRKGRTTFVIAHRLSTIRAADQILVLEEGRIVERGTHAHLMAHAGRYRALHDRQYAVERERYVNPGEELAGEAKAVRRPPPQDPPAGA
jgi:ABC-type multidrug transport system fused ATPase/permease subunit